jgi:hypothetical protein
VTPPAIPRFFITPVLDRYLLYAPVQEFVMILEPDEWERLRGAYDADSEGIDDSLVNIIQRLDNPVSVPPVAHRAIKTPLFLGLIITRGCNMSCRYCDFVAPASSVSYDA